MTEAQSNILRFIREYAAAQGFPPTRKEICERFGFASHNAAQSHLEALARLGAISIRRGTARGIRVLA